jgi:outer membrane lipoprotein LolB
MRIYILIAILSTLYLSGCVSKTAINLPQLNELLNKEQRINQLEKLSQWKITGKIAFIQGKKRESASLHWQINEKKKSQTLNLTTFLGINVLSLTSLNNVHQVKVDGEKHNSKNLEQLIYSLTGLTLPTKAMNLWLKGLAYSENDSIIYHPQTHLPQQLISRYNQKTWQVSYTKYRQFGLYQLPTKLTIKQDNLVIKISINQWGL